MISRCDYLSVLHRFFIIKLHPPKSTLFPYTTLFRSSPVRLARTAEPRAGCRCRAHHQDEAERESSADRSEEHTSELQSQSNLVCRLLLEKKKDDKKFTQTKIPVIEQDFN